ncbi:MAG: ThiF family adenylyltransferase, partial [Novosphingobium sp.]
MSLPPDPLSPAALSSARLNRFARHIVLPEVGGAGQVALSAAHVVLVGCGGIGSPALQYLA